MGMISRMEIWKMCCATPSTKKYLGEIRFDDFFSFIKTKMLFEFWFVSSSFSSTSLLLWGIVWYRSVRPQHKVRTAVCERFQGFVLNIAIAKSPWVQETESRGIGKRLVRQHHLLHNESLALCQQMLTCSLSESVVCSLRGSRQTNKNGIRQTPPKWR